MPSCVVKWCKKRTDHQKRDTGITFHLFPQDPSRRERWAKAVQLERNERDWMPSKTNAQNAQKICSIHFRDDEFHWSKMGFRMLNKTAKPICTMVQKMPDNKNHDQENVNPSQEIPSTSRQRSLMELLSDSPVATTPSLNLTSNREIIEVDPSFKKTLLCKLQKMQDNTTCDKENVNSSQEIPSTSRKRRLVSCPSCGCDFGLTINSAKDDTLEMLQPLSAVSVADSKARCFTPLNIPSSDTDIQSVLNTPKTHKFKKLIKTKSLLSEKRLTKVRRLKRSNDRLLKKIIKLKDITADLKKKKTLETNIGALSSLPTVARDIALSIKKNNEKKREA